MEFWELDKNELRVIDEVREALRPDIKNLDTRITELEVMLFFISIIRKNKHKVTLDEFLEAIIRVCNDYYNGFKDLFEPFGSIKEGGKLDTAVKAVINGREKGSK